MPELSGQEVRALGKKLRDGVETAKDLDLLDNYRNGFEPTLLKTAHAVNACLHQRNIKNIMAGRIKRTKSIIRKLRRPENQGMDLSRMSDVVGLRVILASVMDQDQALQSLAGDLPMVHNPYDYRNRESGYRAIHVISGTPAHRIEIQLRTCPQHYWAVESERLGERTKEGAGTEEAKEFLKRLSDYSKVKDELCTVPPNSFAGQDRCESDLARLIELFERLTKEQIDEPDHSYIVVYDTVTNSLVRIDGFSAAERAEALRFFRDISKTMDQTRYDILVLNSGSQSGLAVTHPLYFPEAPNI